uniref:LisH domain-containing protein n=1 Tax=Anser cygnoides TaxID=8845 RepID=A0A8B9ELD5_ANSCY
FSAQGLAGMSPPSAMRSLALYVYEYLLHVGAQKSAQTFLSEVCLPCLFFPCTMLQCVQVK